MKGGDLKNKEVLYTATRGYFRIGGGLRERTRKGFK